MLQNINRKMYEINRKFNFAFIKMKKRNGNHFSVTVFDKKR